MRKYDNKPKASFKLSIINFQLSINFQLPNYQLKIENLRID